MSLSATEVSKSEQDEQASKAVYFAEVMRKADQRQADNRKLAEDEAAKRHQAEVTAPITLAFGDTSMTLNHEDAKTLASYLTEHQKVFEANPNTTYTLPGGMRGTGTEFLRALSSLILADKV